MNTYTILSVAEQPQLAARAVDWFHEKWHIPREAYAESIAQALKRAAPVPAWYVAVEGTRIVGGLGVIENDFHDRPDLTPNVCAVYVEPDCRCRGIAGAMLGRVCRDFAALGIGTLYLLTDHDAFYERYGWSFCCMAQGEGEERPSRMYVKHSENA